MHFCSDGEQFELNYLNEISEKFTCYKKGFVKLITIFDSLKRVKIDSP